MVKEDHALANVLHVVQQMRGEENRDPPPSDLPHQVEHLPSTRGVEAARRLVEEEEVRVVHERHRELGSLAHPGRELFDRPIPGLSEPREPEHLVRAREGVGPLEPSDLTGERDALHRVQLGDDRPHAPESSRAPAAAPKTFSMPDVPRTSTVPPAGVRNPRSVLRKVLFPAPFGPRSPVIPLSIARSREESASRAPYRTVNPWA